MAQSEDETMDSPEEEFLVWKKNTPFLYDLVISHPLEWPSLTVQWAPLPTHPNSLLLGTHTSEDSPNSLMLAHACLSPSPPDIPLPGVQISKRVPHEGEVNRARYMPQNPLKVATKSCHSEVNVFDLGLENGGGIEVVLTGHETEGYGLSWNSLKEGFLLSGSYDSKICLWNVGATNGEKTLDAHQVFEGHKDVVEDVAWHIKNENIFGSVGDDHKLMIWDVRSSSSDKPVESIIAHELEVNSLSFNPFNEWILATASKDTTVKLFDLRKIGTSLHTFSSHTDEVFQVEWSPNHETILASSSADRRVNVWDLLRIGDEQWEEDADDGPPELLFGHGGHTAKISEFSWNPNEKWVIASVAEDNILHIWQMAKSIYS
ncbi:Histone-binding protein MSI1 [Rhynchospora pubera]|uniref:Histone-binding protein MSI1 n=1 Tax=Rhynchospora pubera TaxID=906938 RepID=A0AAV8EZV5_9POAL|nr:Histone-binding protein MSI1 [Rhynchospora pubera]